jgi:hypothetical protein
VWPRRPAPRKGPSPNILRFIKRFLEIRLEANE